jgi:hypothetical protein
MRTLIALASLLVALAAPGPAAATGPLPLGPPGLEQTTTSEALAPGVRHTRIVRGAPDPRNAWTVDVLVTRREAEAGAAAAEIRAHGLDARVRTLRRLPPVRYLVRSGSFPTEQEAAQRAVALAATGHPGGRVVNTSEDGTTITGPWVINVLTVDPARFRGTLAPALATGIVPGREPLTALSRRLGALAGINGGYFVISDADGTEGDLAGLAVERGRVVSEAVDGRTDLILAGSPSISAVTDHARVRAADGARRELDGDNRAPGLIRACGGEGGDEPTERPKHDFTCTDPSELIAFTRIFGTSTPAGRGAEAVIDRHRRVVALRGIRGGTIPPASTVLSGTGGAAAWLRSHARPGRRLTIRRTLRTEAGRLRPGRGLGVVNGGPRLLRGGRRDITYRREGFDWPDDPGFLYRFGIRRNPRTMAGIARDGRLLLVTVDGHDAGYSVGLSFPEEAALMRALGARDAVNLDGGGSTTMAIRGALINRPSDATGERPIGDALLIRPG